MRHTEATLSWTPWTRLPIGTGLLKQLMPVLYLAFIISGIALISVTHLVN